MGIVNDEGVVITPKKSKAGTVDFEGNVVSGSKNIGYALYDMYMYDNAYKAVGYIYPRDNQYGRGSDVHC